jgi:nitrate/nitrite transport system permease protein
LGNLTLHEEEGPKSSEAGGESDTKPSNLSLISTSPDEAKEKKSFVNWDRVAHTLEGLGLAFFAPFARLAGGDKAQDQLREIAHNIFLPIAAITVFLVAWTACARTVQTDSWKIPGPSETWQAAVGIHQFHLNEREKAETFREKMSAFGETFDAKAAEAMAGGDAAKAAQFSERAEKYRVTPYSGSPTFYDQIRTSLITVGIGFFFAVIIAVPLGIVCGLPKSVNTALNILIQMFKPVSPLAWLPIVFVFVTVLYNPSDAAKAAGFGREVFISACTVTLCSLWPILINTAVGVASIDQDHINVAKVLQLNWWQRLRHLVLPSSLPLMFTGLRISLGVGWMVLIACDMLAQNPGLGKFVWDTFQNGSNESMAQILVAVFAIGLIGFALDRIMYTLQRTFSFSDELPA